MRRGIALVLIGLMLFVSACAKESGNTGESSGNNAENQVDTDPSAKYAQPVEISIGRGINPNYKFEDGDTPDDNPYTRYLKENYNIVAKDAWSASVLNGDYMQKTSLAITSNDLPDAMIVNEAQLREMVKNDQLADLTEVYEKYASPLLKGMYASGERILKDVTYDGKLYALPQVALPAAPLTWIRKDWLDKLGLQPPKTLQDIETIAKAFIDNKMGGDDTIGLIATQQGGTLYPTFMNAADSLTNFSPVFSANNAYPGFWLADGDGKAVYGSIQPETKQTLTLLRDWYAKGLIDKELSLRKSSIETINSGKAGMFFGPWWSAYSLLDAVNVDPNANWQSYAAPLDASGKYNAPAIVATQFIVVKKGYKHPEAVIKLHSINATTVYLDSSLMEDKTVTSDAVPLFVVVGTEDTLDYSVDVFRKILAGEMTIEEVDQTLYPFTYGVAQSVTKVKKEPYDNYDIQYWDREADPVNYMHVYADLVGGATFVDAEVNFVRSVVYSQTETMESRWANLKKMEDEVLLKIILGLVPLEEFDAFVAKWKSQGGDQITAEVSELMG